MTQDERVSDERLAELLALAAEFGTERRDPEWFTPLLSCLRELAQRRSAGWQPISTAPRDGTVMLGWFPYYATVQEGGSVWVMRWNDEHYLPKPRPYFNASGWVWGTRDQRLRQPTHWQPLPPPPFEQEDGK